MALLAGYFVGSCMTDQYAATEYECLYKIADSLQKTAERKMSLEFNSFQSLSAKLNQYIARAKKMAKKNKQLENRKAETQIVEVPVLVEIGVKRAVKNWILKKIRRKED